MAMFEVNSEHSQSGAALPFADLLACYCLCNDQHHFLKRFGAEIGQAPRRVYAGQENAAPNGIPTFLLCVTTRTLQMWKDVEGAELSSQMTNSMFLFST